LGRALKPLNIKRRLPEQLLDAATEHTATAKIIEGRARITVVLLNG